MYDKGLKNYQRNAVSTLQDPQKIVKLLFEAAIKELALARNHFEEPRPRGVHLGKAIAIVGELQAGVNLKEGGEAAEFLYGLYGAIIRELSKINGGGEKDREVIDRSIRYLSELKKIWVEHVLGRNNGTSAGSSAQPSPQTAVAG